MAYEGTHPRSNRRGWTGISEEQIGPALASLRGLCRAGERAHERARGLAQGREGRHRALTPIGADVSASSTTAWCCTSTISATCERTWPVPGGTSALKKALTGQFGSFEAFEQDFIRTGASRSIGWAILYLDPATGAANNHFVQLHEDGNVAGLRSDPGDGRLGATPTWWTTAPRAARATWRRSSAT